MPSPKSLSIEIVLKKSGKRYRRCYETKTIEYHGKDADGVRNLVISFFRKFLIDQFVNFKFSENSNNKTKVT
ncbi:hypothetical protein MSBRW_1694 [Methanosarcina barkeri str. Wiesmoor]|uniref:Uncharacterized protein n=1 Tax=Methanosarcina barkeri str. Wiesmoor TaxID=1434109 RepID=A0A0E3QL46_METBA|nr:hypothetical protein MSBRW_1694 [Methanosarcina barkeri str. Wiesmoor]